jgi:hypothetical protein
MGTQYPLEIEATDHVFTDTYTTRPAKVTKLRNAEISRRQAIMVALTDLERLGFALPLITSPLLHPLSAVYFCLRVARHPTTVFRHQSTAEVRIADTYCSHIRILVPATAMPVCRRGMVCAHVPLCWYPRLPCPFVAAGWFVPTSSLRSHRDCLVRL